MDPKDRGNLALVVDCLEEALDLLREMSHEGYSEIMNESFDYDVPRMIKRARDWSRTILED